MSSAFWSVCVTKPSLCRRFVGLAIAAALLVASRPTGAQPQPPAPPPPSIDEEPPLEKDLTEPATEPAAEEAQSMGVPGMAPLSLGELLDPSITTASRTLERATEAPATVYVITS